MLKAQTLESPAGKSRRLLADALSKNEEDPTHILTTLLQKPPKTREAVRSVHSLLDRLERKLKKQLNSHAAKKKLTALRIKEQQARADKAKLEQKTAEYSLGCTQKLNSLKTFKGLAEELLLLKKGCRPGEVQEFKTATACAKEGKLTTSRLTKCTSRAKAISRTLHNKRKTLKDTKAGLAKCRRQITMLGKTQQFKTFKSF